MKERPWLKWVLIVPGILFVIYIIFYLIRNRQHIRNVARRIVEDKYPELDPEKHKEDYDEAKKEYYEKVDEVTEDLIAADVAHIKHRFDTLFTRD